jgi:hypothetical protein
MLASSAENSFDTIEYVPFRHPPHSNFGIVYSLSLARTPYVLHLDDDVRVEWDAENCVDFILSATDALEKDPTILGINCLNQRPIGPWSPRDEWLGTRPYLGDPSGTFQHPGKYFGTCASLIRRDLVERVPLSQIRSLGASQPDFWEKMVSRSTNEFLAASGETPFRVDAEAWTMRATHLPGRLAEARALIRRWVTKV